LEKHCRHPNRERSTEVPKIQLQRSHQPEEPRSKRHIEAARHGCRSIGFGFLLTDIHLSKLLSSVAVVVALSVGYGKLVHAQGEPPPPAYPAVFGGSVKSRAQESLNLSTSVFGGYDTNPIAGATGVSFGDPAISPSSAFSGLSSDLTFGSRGKTFELQARGGTNLRYYSELGRVIFMSNH